MDAQLAGEDSLMDYIWIVRWQDFQHYRPERDRAPAWIKTYTKQLDDHRYLELTWAQRAILHDLRSAFARSHGRLPSAPRQLSQRLAGRVTSAQLEALSHAGFIDIISRATLEQRLDSLYSSPRARIEVEGEEEREHPNPNPEPVASNGAHAVDFPVPDLLRSVQP